MKTNSNKNLILKPSRSKIISPTELNKPKRKPIEISNNLTNEEIRDLLKKDLSKAQLKAIAMQRAISVGKSNIEEIRQNILKNLNRQEGYGRLASS